MPRFEMRPTDGPWRGVQPRYEKIVRLGPMRFGLTTKLPSGESIVVELGRPPRIDLAELS